MTTVLLVIHFFIAAGLVGLVLMQQSEGGALGSLQGGSGGLMTSRGTTNLLTRTTAIFAAMFFASSLGLGIIYHKSTESKSLISEKANDDFLDDDKPTFDEGMVPPKNESKSN